MPHGPVPATHEEIPILVQDHVVRMVDHSPGVPEVPGGPSPLGGSQQAQGGSKQGEAADHPSLGIGHVDVGVPVQAEPSHVGESFSLPGETPLPLEGPRSGREQTDPCPGVGISVTHELVPHGQAAEHGSSRSFRWGAFTL